MAFDKTKLVPVQSSNLASIGLTENEEGNILRVVFHNGRTYDYWPVPKETYQKAFDPEVKVFTWFTNNIKNNTQIKFKEVHENLKRSQNK